MRPLANRIDNLAQSDIRAITAMVVASNGINLGQGICDMPAPVPIKEAAKQAIDEDRSIYTSYAGIKRLRRGILGKVQSYNRLPARTEEEVIVSAGSTGAFVTAVLALLNPGDEVILFEPFYGYHRNILRLFGAEVRVVSTTGLDWEVDWEGLRGSISDRTRAVVLNTPANPSGKVWTREELLELLGLVEEHDLFVITDEIYEYMVYDGRQHVSLGSLPGAYPRTITISGFSKTYNMTGWRLGYAVGPYSILEKMGLLNDLLYICAPSPLQYAVSEAFSMEDDYFEELLDSYAEKRRMMCEALGACGFDVAWPQGAYYVMADFRPLSRSRDGFANDREACETLIRTAGVASIPGNSFYADPSDGRFSLRFCYAKEFPVLREACDRLLNALGRPATAL